MCGIPNHALYNNIHYYTDVVKKKNDDIFNFLLFGLYETKTKTFVVHRYYLQ